MQLSKETFYELMTLAAETSGKRLSDVSLGFYWGRVKHIEADALRRALTVSASKGRLPTINDLLTECGYAPELSRREKAEHAQPESTVSARDPNETAGQWTWEHSVERPTLEAAAPEFDRAARKLTEAGWTIEETETFECRSVPEGKASSKVVWKRRYHASKTGP